MLLKVYVATAPTDEPFTRTSEIRYPELAVIANVRLVPLDTTTLPDGEMVPPVPAEAVMV
jgi:hypothetical protein